MSANTTIVRQKGASAFTSHRPFWKVIYTVLLAPWKKRFHLQRRCTYGQPLFSRCLTRPAYVRFVQGEKERGEERKEIEKEARAAWSVTGIEDRGRMIARKHVIRSSFSAAVSLLLIGVGHCVLGKRRGQVSPATVATWIISGRRGPTPVFFTTWPGRQEFRVTWFELGATMVKICQQWGVFGQKLLLTEKQSTIYIYFRFLFCQLNSYYWFDMMKMKHSFSSKSNLNLKFKQLHFSLSFRNYHVT